LLNIGVVEGSNQLHSINEIYSVLLYHSKNFLNATRNYRL